MSADEQRPCGIRGRKGMKPMPFSRAELVEAVMTRFPGKYKKSHIKEMNVVTLCETLNLNVHENARKKVPADPSQYVCRKRSNKANPFVYSRQMLFDMWNRRKEADPNDPIVQEFPLTKSSALREKVFKYYDLCPSLAPAGTKVVEMPPPRPRTYRKNKSVSRSRTVTDEEMIPLARVSTKAPKSTKSPKSPKATKIVRQSRSRTVTDQEMMPLALVKQAYPKSRLISQRESSLEEPDVEAYVRHQAAEKGKQILSALKERMTKIPKAPNAPNAPNAPKTPKKSFRTDMMKPSKSRLRESHLEEPDVEAYVRYQAAEKGKQILGALKERMSKTSKAPKASSKMPHRHTMMYVGDGADRRLMCTTCGYVDEGASTPLLSSLSSKSPSLSQYVKSVTDVAHDNAKTIVRRSSSQDQAQIKKDIRSASKELAQNVAQAVDVLENIPVMPTGNGNGMKEATLSAEEVIQSAIKAALLTKEQERLKSTSPVLAQQLDDEIAKEQTILRRSAERLVQAVIEQPAPSPVPMTKNVKKVNPILARLSAMGKLNPKKA